MKKLKNKVFYTIFSILTISLLSFIVVFNVQNYLEEKTSYSKDENENLTIKQFKNLFSKFIEKAKEIDTEFELI